MLVDGEITRSFLCKYSNNSNGDIDLNKLVLTYRQTNNSEDFAKICNKVLGVIITLSRKLQNPDFTESDAFSHGFEVVWDAINKWDATKSSFVTYIYTNLHNKFDTLAYRSKNYRSYLYRKQNGLGINEVSLESLIDDFGDKYFDNMALNLNSSINFIRTNNPFANKLFEFISKHNVVRKSEIAQALGVSEEELLENLKKLKNTLKIKDFI